MIDAHFPLRGVISPLAYGVTAPVMFLSQHALSAAAHAAVRRPLSADLEFWLTPLRTLASLDIDPLLLVLALLFSLLVGLTLVVLSFRRATWSGAGFGFGLAALTAVPLLQGPAILILALHPRGHAGTDAPADVAEIGRSTGAAALGLLAGAILTVVGVGVSTLVFRSYGVGVFVLLPFMVGLTTGYLANRPALLSVGQTMSTVLFASLLGGVGLIVFALEGFVCLLMAAPLGAAMAAGGGAIGRNLAKRRHRADLTMLFSNAALPLVFLLEVLLPPNATLSTQQTIETTASPAAVWAALTRIDAIAPVPGVAFRAGLSYPMGAELHGHAVGAERTGRFSTGDARERVTVWVPERALAFEVLSGPPALKELSPYAHVHAPHVRGYFETRTTRFDLTPSSGGGTRLTVSAAHTLKLDPVLYWAPFARWAIKANTERVLKHVQTQAEGADRSAATTNQRAPSNATATLAIRPSKR